MRRRAETLQRVAGWGGLLALALVGCGGAPASPTRGAADEASSSSPPADCAQAALALQVLGSGGPIADDDRASSGYLVWIDGRARFLVDAGPGTLARYARTGARPSDLRAVLLTHLHVDHSSDLPALLKSASFSARSEPLAIYGPTGGSGFPGLTRFVEALMGDGGAYPYLGYLGEDPPFELRLRELDAEDNAPATFLEDGSIAVRAVGVEHGPVPALAFDVSVGERRVAFMGDQDAASEGYAQMIEGADLLVAHLAVGLNPSGPAARLHAAPPRLGEVARAADVGAMVLSHIMLRASRDLEGSLAAIRASYAGPVTVAEDGLCLRVR